MSVAEYQCDPGFKLVGEPCYVQCGASGTWSKTTAHCEPIGRCSIPPKCWLPLAIFIGDADMHYKSLPLVEFKISESN